MSLHDKSRLTPDHTAFDRRDFLRFLSGGALILTSGGLLAGCGGGGGNSSDAGGNASNSTVLFSSVQPAGPDGLQISDVARNITLTIPSQTLISTTSASLQVLAEQRSGVTPQGFTSNINAVDISLDPAALASGKSIQIQIPLPGMYDPFGSMMFATNDTGVVFPLEVTYDAVSNSLTGSVAAEHFQLNTISPKISSGHSALLHPHGLGSILRSIGVFIVTVVRAVSPADGKFFIFNSGAFQARQDMDTMGGKRIALVVHGIFSDHMAMQELGSYLSGNDGGHIKYDETWCYEYNFGAHISDNGRLLAQKLNAEIAAGAKSVDIIAHSMGGLVSRWALEKEGLGMVVNRLITLDTPHEGTPVLLLQFLTYALSKALRIDIASIIPGINDLGAAISLGSLQQHTVLTDLNDGDSRYKDTADYYTSAGKKYENLAFLGANISVGSIVNLLFGNFGANAGTIVFDGIVPQYSALSNVLSRKSTSWSKDPGTHTLTLDLNHIQVPLPESESSVRAMLDNWIGINSGTVQIARLTPETKQSFPCLVSLKGDFCETA